jgi:hypothetical protein
MPDLTGRAQMPELPIFSVPLTRIMGFVSDKGYTRPPKKGSAACGGALTGDHQPWPQTRDGGVSQWQV